MLSAPLGGSDMIAYSSWHRGHFLLPATAYHQFWRSRTCLNLQEDFYRGMMLLGSRSIPAEGCVDVGLINEAFLIVSCFYRCSTEFRVISIKAAVLLDCFVSFLGDHSMCPVVINGCSCVCVIIQVRIPNLFLTNEC